ncbi:MAG: Na+/H+ antiporter subunit E [Exiguobacterium sp.]|uniref:Na+/H+ antiporter subunit E n=1 Tax=Exiguobacterium alkaliphilum TaxID=1428684 RepID=A0ABT2KZB6_9BACL|nr:MULTISPECIES: Na+/H+ antiporter subunit E [Exiguobacterium]MDX5323143.1 Na+/H+ antiporter subunit E [Exiguobacterium sp.]KDN57070.1 monovalent cation/H+ antiporter subunit E [Exiguobacterium sp. AB2]MCT4796267.1 Na+/H+ antiporter subunit E [Exiguobacterium alkaliphilum]MDX5424925.1 Na+/H+ antiporter subunit E [Exiguobacterium sp.]MDX6772375.1 Na+/H+ antiporter subunit E [Exiguobacterium sp.]
MAYQILINFFLAFIWMFLTGSFTTYGFLIGYILGLLVIFMMRRFFRETGTNFYFMRVIKLFKLLLIFSRELVMANFEVLRLVLSPKLEIQPGIFRYETSLKSGWKISLLSMLISLTPGTLVVQVSQDSKILYIHALHMPDKEALKRDIYENFESSIKEATE